MTNDVVVLGLGRMGRAMAARYADAGWQVRSWSRSGGGTAPTARAATEGSGVIVLALFDDRACDAVLDELGDAVAGRLVVNTSTISVDGAEAAARRVADRGGRYVHAPVLGSVPAVLNGTLRVLAGGTDADLAEAEQVLEPLADDVRHVGTAGGAAAAKLVANSSLAGAALALRDSLDGAAALGLPLADALDLLVLGRLGELAASVRARLADPGAAAYFTVAAIAKDVRLLADASGPPGLADRIAALVDDGDVQPDDDFTALAVPTTYLAEVR
ncbi:NAD(P)-dependent oxidoreductase [Nocardioides sp.]|uniref:NAD(P)-dependent oxidoreductase n=1 Tax=Nocardioides sp. TaxID=35761 RepID=UPI0035B462DB